MSTNLALLGSGIFATTAYLPALLEEENKHVNLHTVWSRSKASAEKLGSAAKDQSGGKLSPRLLFGDDGLQTILQDKDVEGVMLVLPITTQMELVPKIMAAGKHVSSEKPIAKDVASARKLVEMYEKEYKPKGLIWRIAEGECSGHGKTSKLTSRLNRLRSRANPAQGGIYPQRPFDRPGPLLDCSDTRPCR